MVAKLWQACLSGPTNADCLGTPPQVNLYEWLRILAPIVWGRLYRYFAARNAPGTVYYFCAGLSRI